jgi:hypothetical protein
MTAASVMTMGAFILSFLLYYSFTDSKEAHASSFTAPVVPRVMNNSGIMQGAMVDERGHESASIEQIQHFNSLVGKKVDVVYFSDRWYNGIKFPAGISSQITAAGAIPFIRIQPADTYDGGGISSKLTNANIAAGKYDAQIRQYALDVKNFGTTVMIQYGVEVNGDWFSWSKEGPEPFKAAYRHLVGIFESIGVTNVEWALHLDITENSDGYKWYPGNFISWVGTSCYGAYGYGQDGCIPELKKHYAHFASISGTARLGIFEWGLGDASDTASTLRTLATDPLFSRIKLLQVWNEREIPGYPEDKVPDGRINVNLENLQAYRAGIASMAFGLVS